MATTAVAQGGARGSRIHSASGKKKRRVQLVPAGPEDSDYAGECMPGDGYLEVSAAASEKQQSSADEEPEGEEDEDEEEEEEEDDEEEEEEEEEEAPPAREVRRSKRDHRVPRERRTSSSMHGALVRKAGRRRRESGVRAISRAGGTSAANDGFALAAGSPMTRMNASTKGRKRKARSPRSQETSDSDEPARKRGRAANALAVSTVTDRPLQRTSSLGSRAVSSARSPGTAAGNAAVTSASTVDVDTGARSSNTNFAEVVAQRPRGSNDDFLRRVLRANGQQVKKGGSGGLVAIGAGQLEPLGEAVDRPSALKPNGAAAPSLKQLSRTKGVPGMRKALSDLASQVDRRSRRV